MDIPSNSETNPRFQKVDKVILLSQCPVFSGLNQWELQSISRLMRLVEYKRDEVVYREGGDADGFYVIVSGRFEASVSSDDKDKRKVLAYLKRGDHFGEMSLLTNQPHSATLRALSDSLVLELKKEDFKKTIEHNATISLELSRRLTSRIKNGEASSQRLLKNDIVAIFSNRPNNGPDAFSLNLAASLFQETHQKTILVELGPARAESRPSVGAAKKIALQRLENIETVSNALFEEGLIRHPVGFDLLSLFYEDRQTDSLNTVAALLNHLTIDYRFILVNLPDEIDEVVFKTLTQSDSVYFVTDSSMNSVMQTKEFIAGIEKHALFTEDKISIVIHEAFLGMRTTIITRKELFGKKMCLSLPAADSNAGRKAGGGVPMPLVADNPETEYSRMVRHVARHISNNLVGLALGSGAALGLAHIGVLKILEREKIPIDIISGSSIGALIASLYAVGKNAVEIEQSALRINSRLKFMCLLDPSLPPVRGLFGGKRIIKHFRTQLSNKTFDHCRIPLKIIGANLTTRQIHIFESGYIADAVRASIAIPAIFKPTLENGDVIVDGGILSPLPIRALRQAGANKIIAVNVFPTSKDALERRFLREEADEKEAMQIRQRRWPKRFLYHTKKYFVKRFSTNIFDVLMSTIQSMESEIAEIEGESADVLLRPVLPAANWVQFYKPQQFVKRGEEEALRLAPKIKALVSQQNT
ncbi:MAG: cyclic nucleotide-binding domain-containing protein [Candidatus Omnitrophica bacterium]|nr:cyclic nucleotide-binding domain-containing protein [Candidatus Omnitrophota bacterium]